MVTMMKLRGRRPTRRDSVDQRQRKRRRRRRKIICRGTTSMRLLSLNAVVVLIMVVVVAVAVVIPATTISPTATVEATAAAVPAAVERSDGMSGSVVLLRRGGGNSGGVGGGGGGGGGESDRLNEDNEHAHERQQRRRRREQRRLLRRQQQEEEEPMDPYSFSSTTTRRLAPVSTETQQTTTTTTRPPFVCLMLVRDQDYETTTNLGLHVQGSYEKWDCQQLFVVPEKSSSSDNDGDSSSSSSIILSEYSDSVFSSSVVRKGSIRPLVGIEEVLDRLHDELVEDGSIANTSRPRLVSGQTLLVVHDSHIASDILMASSPEEAIHLDLLPNVEDVDLIDPVTKTSLFPSGRKHRKLSITDGEDALNHVISSLTIRAVDDDDNGNLGSSGSSSNNNNSNHNRLLGQWGPYPSLGTKSVLVVITEFSAFNEDQTSLAVFGDGQNMDDMNLRTWTDRCSGGRRKIVPASGNRHIKNGVIKVNIDMSSSSMRTHHNVRDNMVRAVQSKLGVDDLSSKFDHVMICTPQQTTGIYTAYAWKNYHLSVYYHDWCRSPSVQLHEIGHNINLDHSGQNGIEYDDETGIMGYSDERFDGPKMCFNPAKNWRLGWYDVGNQALSLDPLTHGSKTVRLKGVADFDPNNSDKTEDTRVVVRLAADNPGINNMNDQGIYLGFNRAKGPNIGTVEERNKVLIVSDDGLDEFDLGTRSSLLKGLSYGQEWKLDNYSNSGRNLIIKWWGYDHGPQVSVYFDRCVRDTDCDYLRDLERCPGSSLTSVTCQNGQCMFKSDSACSDPTRNLQVSSQSSNTNFGWTLTDVCTGETSARGNDFFETNKEYRANVRVDMENGRYMLQTSGSGSGQIKLDGLDGTGTVTVPSAGFEFGDGCQLAASSTLSPTSRPSPSPTVSPTAFPTSHPTNVPTGSPTAAPTSQPTNIPTASPTAVPTSQPTHIATASPTAFPTSRPTNVPTASPTGVPTSQPTNVPTAQPSESPTKQPTEYPTLAPVSPSPATTFPTVSPTPLPSPVPTPTSTLDSTVRPTPAPVTPSPTSNPTSTPTPSPTAEPTAISTQELKTSPFENHSPSPTILTTSQPTDPLPTLLPTAQPTTSAPTNEPTPLTTNEPSAAPVEQPTNAPVATNDPSLAPVDPTSAPFTTSDPTETPFEPTDAPLEPTNAPITTSDPTDAPLEPTDAPVTTYDPTSAPLETTLAPAEPPTDAPITTNYPTAAPFATAKPTAETTSISRVPSQAPSEISSSEPSLSPSITPSSGGSFVPSEAPVPSPSAGPTFSLELLSSPESETVSSSPSAKPSNAPSVGQTSPAITSEPSLTNSPSITPSVSSSSEPSSNPSFGPSAKEGYPSVSLFPSLDPTESKSEFDDFLFTMDVESDGHGNETYWELWDKCDDTLVDGDTMTVTAVVNLQLQVNRKYRLNIIDKAGDGLCPENEQHGNLTLTIDGSIVEEVTPCFGHALAYSFGQCGVQQPISETETSWIVI